MMPFLLRVLMLFVQLRMFNWVTISYDKSYFVNQNRAS